MRLFNKIAIIGTGLIGGSIALDIKRLGLAYKVIGVSRKEKSIHLARSTGAIDYGSTSLSVASDADAIVLATSVDSIIEVARKLSCIIKKETLVTDVGSTKEMIVSALETLFPRFVGAHPLAGSEKKSIANAKEGIFQNSLCILTPTSRTDLKALRIVKSMWRLLGAKAILMSPKEHDKVLSFTSHLPHTVAFSLINSIPSRYFNYAAAGLRDTTRIASSSSELWSEILLSNNNNVAEALACFQAELDRLKEAIIARDRKSLRALLRRAQKKRERLQ